MYPKLILSSGLTASEINVQHWLNGSATLHTHHTTLREQGGNTLIVGWLWADGGASTDHRWYIR